MLTEAFRWLKAVLGQVVKMHSRKSTSLENLSELWRRKRPSMTSAASQFMATLRCGTYAFPDAEKVPSPTRKATKQVMSWLPRGIEFEDSDIPGVFVVRGSQALSGRTTPKTPRKGSVALSSRETSADFLNDSPEDFDNDSQTVRINVGGQTFIVSRTALNRYPDTVLGRLTARSPSFDRSRREYFFDRNPCVFQSVLDLYRINELHLPRNVCGKTALNELEFWGIPAIWVSACCWSHIHEVIKDERLYQDLNGGGVSCELIATSCNYRSKRMKGGLWSKLYDLRRSYRSRQVWNIVVALLILLSVSLFVADTYTEIRMEEYFHTYLATNRTHTDHLPDRVNRGIWIAELVVLGSLVVEFIVLLAVSPRQRSFGFSSVFYLTYGLSLLGSCVGYSGEAILSTPDRWVKVDSLKTVYLFTRCVRWLRILRLLEVLDWHSSLYVMWVAIMNCHMELLLLLVVFFIQAVIFGAFTFYLERHMEDHNMQNSTEEACRQTEGKRKQFVTDLPTSLYWAIITMTTVGYGDITPSTPHGRVVGALCALSGVLVLALPVAILIESFQQYNMRQKIRQEKQNCQAGYFRSTSLPRNCVDVNSRVSV